MEMIYEDRFVVFVREDRPSAGPEGRERELVHCATYEEAHGFAGNTADRTANASFVTWARQEEAIEAETLLEQITCAQRRSPMLSVEAAGGVMVVHVNWPVLINEFEISKIFWELSQLAASLDKPHLLLDWSGALRVSSRLVSVIARLHDQVKKAGGRLALCGLVPDLARVFEITGLNKFLHIYDHECEAMDSFVKTTRATSAR